MDEQQKDAVAAKAATPVATVTESSPAKPAASGGAAVPPAAIVAVPPPVDKAAGEKGATAPSAAPPATRPPPRAAAYARRAAVVAAALGLGWLGGWATSVATPGASAAVVALGANWLAPALSGPRLEEGEWRKLAGDVEGLKGAIDDLRAGLDRNRQDGANGVASIGERLDTIQRTHREESTRLAGLLQRAEQAAATKLAGLAERFEKVERADRDPTPRLAQIAERLERMERQMAVAPPAPAAPAAKPLAAAVAEPAKPSAAPELKPTTVENWALRDVYDGVALVEGKNRRMMEIAPGQNLPGVGRVEAIERRGRSWIVVTSRGIITSQAW